jgi:hypothetical protein
MFVCTLSFYDYILFQVWKYVSCWQCYLLLANVFAVKVHILRNMSGYRLKKGIKKPCVCTVMAFFYVSLICDNSVTTTTVSQPQQCHNHNSVTTTTVPQPQQCHNHNCVTTTTVSQPQQCHNHNTVTTTTVPQPQQCHDYNTVTTTTPSRLQQCHDFNSVTTQNLWFFQ